MTIASHNPTGVAFLLATPVSARIAIPTTGTPTVVLVTNLGQLPVFVALGNATVVAVAKTGGTPVMPGQQIALAISGATYLAAVTLYGDAGVHLSAGT